MIPPNEKIIETKKCALSGQEFVITDTDIKFLDAVSPVFNGKKYAIPTPTLCPEERQRRRLAFRNERKLYKRKCDFSGQEIFSIYSPEKTFPIYHNDHWYSDAWSSLTYGKKINFDTPIFDQFHSIRLLVPRLSLATINNENCPYANQIWYSKNVYMSFDIGFCQDVYYSNRTYHCENTLDSIAARACHYSYFCIDCFTCDRCVYMLNSKNCSDSGFCYDCDGCTDVFFCSHLRNAQKQIFNRPATDEEIRTLRKQLHDGKKWNESIDVWKNTVIGKTFHRCNLNINSENCAGDYITNSDNCYICFDYDASKNCRYCTNADEKVFDCSDTTNCVFLHHSYEGLSIAGGNILFSHASFDENNRDLLYCDLCTTGNNSCFLCVGLHNHEHHCILNTSYSTQEYEMLAGKIIDHMRSTKEWGEFLPHTLSPYGYNETVAMEYFPMTEEAVRTKGWNWYAGENKNTYIGPYYQPLPIDQYDEKIVGYDIAEQNIDELLTGILECEVTKKPFKIIKQELIFYIENHIPIPTKHPDVRHQERMNARNPRKLFQRKCCECGAEIHTTYAPERPERVVCETCYRKLVY